MVDYWCLVVFNNNSGTQWLSMVHEVLSSISCFSAELFAGLQQLMTSSCVTGQRGCHNLISHEKATYLVDCQSWVSHD